jgi:hypothetical protein
MEILGFIVFVAWAKRFAIQTTFAATWLFNPLRNIGSKLGRCRTTNARVGNPGGHETNRLVRLWSLASGGRGQTKLPSMELKLRHTFSRRAFSACLLITWRAHRIADPGSIYSVSEPLTVSLMMTRCAYAVRSSRTETMRVFAYRLSISRGCRKLATYAKNAL